MASRSPRRSQKLPKVPGSDMPYVEGFLYLLLTGDVPTKADAEDVFAELKARAAVPHYVFDVLRAMPRDSHPMTMLSAAILCMQRDSIYVKRYNEGLGKNDHWDPTYEDAMNLIARLPEIGAYIFRMKYRSDTPIPPDPKLDWGGNFAHMMGVPKPYDDVSRLYFILHSDHESGNVSAHTGHLVASALSDVYYAGSAMINGLAGPLHGLANQEVLRWIQDVMEKMGGKIPTEEEMGKFVWETLESGQVVPGFGHAVLRKTDPRYMEQRNFCLKHLPNDPIFKYVDLLFKVMPPDPGEAGQGQEPLAQRGRPVRRHPVVLRRPGVRLLHRPLRHRPRPRRDVEHHLGPRPRLPDRAAEVGDDGHAGGGGRQGGGGGGGQEVARARRFGPGGRGNGAPSPGSPPSTRRSASGRPAPGARPAPSRGAPRTRGRASGCP